MLCNFLLYYCVALLIEGCASTEKDYERRPRAAFSPYFQFGYQPQNPYSYNPSETYQPETYSTDGNFKNSRNKPPPSFSVLLPFVYDGCGNSKGCFGLFESSCVALGNCDALVTYTTKGQLYEFELWAPNASSGTYVAFGLSSDNKMGEDSVIECSVLNGRVDVFLSFNEGKGNARLGDSSKWLRVLETRYNDGNLYCRVERLSPYEINGRTFDLSHNLFILLARGSSSESGLRYHERQKTVSQRSVNFAELSAVRSSSGVLIKLHGSFMVVAWMFTASIGILFARYFRLTFVGKQFMGKDLWFVFHRGLMTVTWCLTILAFIIIFAELGGWTSVPTGSNPHALIGVFTTLLAFVQPILAYFRPHPGTPNRYIFNWAHWLVGNAAHILGTVCIFLAVRLDKAAIPYSLTWVLVTYLVIHSAVHGILSYAPRYIAAQNGSSGAMDMQDVQDISYQNSQAQLSQLDRKQDPPGSKFQRNVLLAYILLVGSFAAAVVGVIANGPWI